jgi:Yip1 domain
MTFLRRTIGAAMFDSATYEEVERDQSATAQSMLVVVLSSVAAGVGATGLYDAGETIRFVAVASVLALLTWGSWALLTLQIGTRILPARETSADVGQLLRVLGFAAAPGLIQVFAVFPGMLMPVFLVAIGWTIAASVVAVRHALDYSSLGRAVAVCALGWLLAFTFLIVLGMVFGPALS